MTRILFSPRQPDVILDIARSLTPPGFELVVADPGTPEFYQAAADAEFYLGLIALRRIQSGRAGGRRRAMAGIVTGGLGMAHIVITLTVMAPLLQAT